MARLRSVIFTTIVILMLVAAVGVPLALNGGQTAEADVAPGAVITLDRDPYPPSYLLNDGTTTEHFGWRIEYDSTCDYYRFYIEDPHAVTVYGPFVFSCESSPIVRDIVTNPFDWAVPSCQEPGTYEAFLEFWSTEVGLESTATQTFWIRQELQVLKYNDVNGDGQRDPGDTGLPGWHFTVEKDAAYYDDGNTDGSGMVTFLLVTEGTYVVTETLQAGWRNTDPGPPAPYAKTLLVPEDPCDEIMEFGNQESAELTIFKYNDRDGDGHKDVGDTGLNGWDFHITGPGGYDVNLSTSGGGYIHLTGLSAGNYTATETVKAGWINTDPGGMAPHHKSVDLPATGSETLEFGNYEEPTDHRVPTVNQWGIVAMITLFAGLLVWTVRRRRPVS